MRDRAVLRIAPIAALVLAAALVGCLGRTPPTTLYLLAALDSEPERAAGGIDAVVGVGPVTLPEYLRRSEIVTRTGCQGSEEFCAELQLAELDRWAEPLEEAITRVLAEDLSILLATENVVRYPWRSTPPVTLQVTVDLVRFDVDAAGRTELIARWSVVDPETEAVLHLARSTHGEPAAAGYGAKVSALSRALAELAREMAGVLEALPESSEQ
jgi:hypothetical protein